MTALTHEFLDLQAALAGEYSLERELGRGGMGVVFLARDVQLDRHVAIKVLLGHLAAGTDSRERFLREARTAARLSHPNIVPIHRVGEAAGLVYFVMSYVPGETLGERLRRTGPLAAADAMRVLREVSWALAYAHGHGIVHRDVKPDNILLEEGSGRALVTDFGIAHVGSTTLSTDPGKIMGTAQFMSPEQAMSETVDGRSDLYSLGAVGYLAVSGKLPFEAANLPALLMKHVSEPATSIADVAPGVPRALASAIDRCLEKRPENRFSNGEELADALTPSNDGRPQLPVPLRTWLAERNPATIPYAVWSGLLGIPMAYQLTGLLNFHRLIYAIDLAQFGILAAAPLLAIVGFHANRAQRLFRAGFTLVDLRGAMDVAALERAESDALEPDDAPSGTRKFLRRSAYAAFALSSFITFLPDVIHLTLERRHILLPFVGTHIATLAAWVGTVALFSAMQVYQVPLLSSRLRNLIRGGVREKLWRSRLGEWLAGRLGAPSTSRAVGAGVFQATELALGIAAADLFKALPSEYREQLRELPSIVAALGTRAAAARAEIDALDALPRNANDPSDALASRRAAAGAELAHSVAALEGVRLDLLRLLAGATDLAPLTTLLDAARELGEHAARLSEAQREVAAFLPTHRTGTKRVPTPV